MDLYSTKKEIEFADNMHMACKCYFAIYCYKQPQNVKFSHVYVRFVTHFREIWWQVPYNEYDINMNWKDVQSISEITF